MSLTFNGGIHGFGGCPGCLLQLKWNDFCIRSGLNLGKNWTMMIRYNGKD